jgi:hypothetical protein
MRKTCGILVRKPEVKRPLGRPRRRWEDNIRMDLTDRCGFIVSLALISEVDTAAMLVILIVSKGKLVPVLH